MAAEATGKYAGMAGVITNLENGKVAGVVIAGEESGTANNTLHWVLGQLVACFGEVNKRRDREAFKTQEGICNTNQCASEITVTRRRTDRRTD